MFDWIRQQIEEKTAPAEQDTRPEIPGEKYLIVGLGNPGREYRGNRHNIGFMAVDKLAAAYNIHSSRVEHKAIVGKGRIEGRSVIIAKPQTFMNLSGESVRPLLNYYKIPQANLLVIYDELDVSFGDIRLRMKGGTGGHNGIRSIIQHLDPDFARMRLGIGRPPGKLPVRAWVLQDFLRDQQPVLDMVLDEAVAAVHTFLRDGIDLAMTRHNGPVMTGE